MSKKIDISLLKQRIIWTAVMFSISALLILSINKKINNKLGNIKVNISQLEGKKNLISEQEIITLFKNYLGINDLAYLRVKKLNTSELEELLNKDKRIKNAEIYVDGKGMLNVDIIQKQPIVRMMDGSSKGYYLDKYGNRIPLVKNTAVRVPLATGNFELYEESIFKSNKPQKIKEIFAVAKAIYEDKFMHNLVEQINVDENGELILVPKIGRQYIVLGDTSFLPEKFDNLKIMYKEGLPREGWSKYTALILKFRGQVVARTSENLVIPRDTLSVVDASKVSPANTVKTSVHLASKPIVKAQENVKKKKDQKRNK